MWSGVLLIWAAISAAVLWPRLNDLPGASESPVKWFCSISPNLSWLVPNWLFLKQAYKKHDLSKRTYSLAPHKGKVININTTFSRNHHSGKTVTPYEKQDMLQTAVSCHIPVAARKSSCPCLIHTNIHVAAQQAEPVPWGDSSCGHLSSSAKDGAGIRSMVGVAWDSRCIRGQGSPWKITKGKPGLKPEANCGNRSSAFGEATKGWTPLPSQTGFYYLFF